MDKRQDIWVSGAPRSGTAWLGQALSKASGYIYVYEPLNPNNQTAGSPLKKQYPHPSLEEFDAQKVKKYLNQRLDTGGRYLMERLTMGSLADRLYYLKTGFKSRLYPGRLVKDPNALFLMPWLVSELKVAPLFIVRHPGAFLYSMKKKGWGQGPAFWRNRPDLIRAIPKELRPRLLDPGREVPSGCEAAFDWYALNAFLLRIRQQYPAWIILRHEELLSGGTEAFKNLYDRLGLQWNDEARRWISASIQPSSGLQNARDPQLIAAEWKTALSHDEIDFIMDFTRPVWQEFYTEQSWRFNM